MSTIAIIGAGPQLGLAIARTFGSHGFHVALIARDRSRLDGLVSQLGVDGITAAAFPADVLDHEALTQALRDAAGRLVSPAFVDPHLHLDKCLTSQRSPGTARNLDEAIRAVRAIKQAVPEIGVLCDVALDP